MYLNNLTKQNIKQLDSVFSAENPEWVGSVYDLISKTNNTYIVRILMYLKEIPRDLYYQGNNQLIEDVIIPFLRINNKELKDKPNSYFIQQLGAVSENSINWSLQVFQSEETRLKMSLFWNDFLKKHELSYANNLELLIS